MAKKNNCLEIDFKKWARAAWLDWSTAIEPKLGSDIGAADLLVAVDGRLVPIELKVAECAFGSIRSENIRPSQISWHTRCPVPTYFLFGVYDRSIVNREPASVWCVRFGDGKVIRDWQSGIEKVDARQISVRDFRDELHSFLREALPV